MNIERTYQTTVPAEELAQALADHFRAQEFEAQILHTPAGGMVMQARKESTWRQALGVAYAATVTLTPREGHLSIALADREWVDTALSGAIGLVAIPPVLIGTVYGIWKEDQLDQEVWRVIEERTGRAEPPATIAPAGSTEITSALQ